MHRTALRRFAVVAIVLSFALITAPASAAIVVAQATLTGDQENPPVDTSALGAAIVAIDTVADTYSVAVFVEGITPARLTASPAHIHIGAVGVNGPVINGFLEQGGTVSPFGTSGFQLVVENAPFAGDTIREHGPSGIGPATTLQHLLDGNLYVNIHTVADFQGIPGFPGGEIRGQLSVVPEPASLGLLGLGMLGLLRRRRPE